MIDKINEMKMKLGRKVTLRKAEKTKVDSEISMKAVNSTNRKRVEEAMYLGQGDDRLLGTDRILTDVAMVPLIAEIKSTGYKIKRSDRTLTGATLEMEILSQCGESTIKDFKPSPMNHEKGSVVGHLVPVEYNRLTVSKTVSIDEAAGGYMEMLEIRNLARGRLMALEEKSAIKGYKIHPLIARFYMRTELQLRFAWCMIGLTRGEYDSEERKRSKEEKVFLMTSVRDLMTQERSAVACAKRRDALCFVRFMIEQISVPALSTCVKMLREDDERAKALLLLALSDIYQSKPMRVNMKEPEELEPMNKFDKIKRFSNKELRLSKESMGALPKSSEYCGPIRMKSCSYVSGVIGIAYNPFLNEDIRDCFFDYEQAVLLKFWMSRIASLGGKVYCTISAKIGQPSRVWIGILTRTAENEFDGSVGTNEIIMVSESQCRFDITSDTRSAEGIEFRL